jgi:hypothetical protein
MVVHSAIYNKLCIFVVFMPFYLVGEDRWLCTLLYMYFCCIYAVVFGRGGLVVVHIAIYVFLLYLCGCIW